MQLNVHSSTVIRTKTWKQLRVHQQMNGYRRFYTCIHVNKQQNTIHL